MKIGEIAKVLKNEKSLILIVLYKILNFKFFSFSFSLIKFALITHLIIHNLRSLSYMNGLWKDLIIFLNSSLLNPSENINRIKSEHRMMVTICITQGQHWNCNIILL